MTRHIKKIAIGVLLLFYGSAFSQHTDPIFEGLKTFFNNKTNCTLNKELFTVRAKNEAIPFTYIYVSKPNTVENVLGDEPYIYINIDTAKATELCTAYSEKGYSTFRYKTFGTSDAYITKTLLSYSRESKAFLVFHELMHNYIFEDNISMSYACSEAACDVIAVNFSKQLLKEKHVLNAAKVDVEIKALETVYRIINAAIKRIETDSASCAAHCADAEKQIAVAVKNCDAFFKDRFLHPVTTAYLLKNSNYCRRYFIVSEIYLDSKNFEKFIQSLTFYSGRLL